MADIIDEPADLTNQEKQVLEFLADGLSDSEIAVRLGLAPAGLNEHFDSILRKLGSRSRTEAAVRAFKWRLLALFPDLCLPYVLLTTNAAT